MSSEYLVDFLIQANVSLLLLGGFYWLFLSRLSFHSWKRFFILFGLLASILIPLLDFVVTIPSSDTLEPIALSQLFAPVEYVSVNEEVTTQPAVATLQLTILFRLIALALVVFGALRLSWFAIRWIHLIRKLDNGSYYDASLGVNITDEFNMPFAFNNKVYIPVSLLSSESEELDKIIRHEKKHVMLKHGFDKWVLELAGAFFWFNPIFQLCRKEQCAIHEYEADDQFSHSHERTPYSELLVTLTNKPQSIPSIVSPFSRSLIENRVRRLNQPKSNAMKKGIFFLSTPLLLVLIYAFSIRFEKELVRIDRHDQPTFTSPIDLTQVTNYSAFGMRKVPDSKATKMHTGIDLAAKRGTDIYASANGVITLIEDSEEGHGKRIGISHDDQFESRYSHLDEILVRSGQSVSSGQLIGKCGSTGRSFGPHLHFEILQNDSHVNPEDFLLITSSSLNSRPEGSELMVIIDPGHGGDDHGVVIDDLDEKDLTLDYAIELKEQLNAMSIGAVIVRDDDMTMTLKDRISATKAEAEMIYLSLHFNESVNKAAQGVEIYISEKEDLNQLKSKLLARHLGAELSSNTINNRGLKTANFYVLKEAECPALLLELGFLSSEPDAARIQSEEYRTKMCNAVAESIRLYAK